DCPPEQKQRRLPRILTAKSGPWPSLLLLRRTVAGAMRGASHRDMATCHPCDYLLSVVSGVVKEHVEVDGAIVPRQFEVQVLAAQRHILNSHMTVYFLRLIPELFRKVRDLILGYTQLFGLTRHRR